MAGHGVDNDDDDDDEKTCHLPTCNEMQKLHAASQGQLCGAAFQFGQQAMRIVGATSNKHSSIIPAGLEQLTGWTRSRRRFFGLLGISQPCCSRMCEGAAQPVPSLSRRDRK